MLPLCTYIYSNNTLDEVQPVRDMLDKRVRFYVKTKRGHVEKWNRFVPIAGTAGPELLTLAKTGDFCITSASHRFLGMGFRGVMPNDAGHYVITSPLPPKHILSSLFCRAMALSELTALIARGDTISLRNRRIRKLAFKLALKRSQFQLPFRKAHLLRSVLDAFGYNLICCKVLPESEEGVFVVRWRRKFSVRLLPSYPLRATNDIRIRFVAENVWGQYSAVGFIHYH